MVLLLLFILLLLKDLTVLLTRLLEGVNGASALMTSLHGSRHKHSQLPMVWPVSACFTSFKNFPEKPINQLPYCDVILGFLPLFERQLASSLAERYPSFQKSSESLKHALCIFQLSLIFQEVGSKTCPGHIPTGDCIFTVPGVYATLY